MKNATLKFISTGIFISLTTAMSHSALLFSEHDKQVDALLAQMTLDEKIGQMVQVDSSALKDKAAVQKYFLGSVLSGGSSDPADGNSVQSWLKFVSEFQNQALQTRLKIPLIYGINAVDQRNFQARLQRLILKFRNEFQPRLHRIPVRRIGGAAAQDGAEKIFLHGGLVLQRAGIHLHHLADFFVERH